MRNKTTFITRRGLSSDMSATWTRNRNTVRHTQKGLGKISSLAIVGILTLGIGLIYVGQATKGTSFDYEISEVEKQIVELEAKKDDLAVEKARLTSISETETSEVAVKMEDATVSGYAAE